MKLHLLPSLNHKKIRRVGRGESSGMGKTSGRGQTGAKSRSGYRASPVTSGIPWYRKLPMRGFSNFLFKKDIVEVSLNRILMLEKSEIDPNVLKEAGLVRSDAKLIKVIGKASLDKPLSVKAHAFTAGAKQSIEAAGGTASIIEG